MTPTDQPRHPLCVTPAFYTPRGAQHDMIDRQATLILELKAKLEAAAGREVALRDKLHKQGNVLTTALGALQVIAMLLGLRDDASPPEVMEAAAERFK